MTDAVRIAYLCNKKKRAPAATKLGSILTMKFFWIVSLSSSWQLSRLGTRLFFLRLPRTGTAFGRDCRHMAWIPLIKTEEIFSVSWAKED
jgi:hypothetical protein